MKPSQVDFTHLDKALKTLREGVEKTSLTQLEKDGVIQRFEYSFELLWKTAKKVLEVQGVAIGTPKSVIRELGRLGWIEDVEIWFEFLQARNRTSHEYGEKLAAIVLKSARDFLPLAENLVMTLKEKAIE